MFAPPNAVCLDPYIGSGSLAVAALTTERLSGESATETSCPKCVKKILEQYQPPMPNNVSVVGIDGNLRWLDVSIQRIRQTAPEAIAA
jgi:DNA modification methylase